MNWVAKRFVIAFLSRKGVKSRYIHVLLGWTLKTIHALLTNLWGILCAFIQIFMQYWNFENDRFDYGLWSRSDAGASYELSF